MTLFAKAATIIALLMFGTTNVLAQTQTDPPKAPTQSGSVKDEKPTNPNEKRPTEVEKLKKEEEKTKGN